MNTYKKWLVENANDLREEYKEYLTSMISDDEVETIEDWDTWNREEYQVLKEHEAVEKCIYDHDHRENRGRDCSWHD